MAQRYDEKTKTTYEEVSCRKCGKPINRITKVGDHSDTHFECLSSREQAEVMSDEYMEDALKRFNC